MELWIYDGIRAPVEGMEGEIISHICWYTESQSWQ